MAISVTNDVSSLVALTRQLNAQNLARLDEQRREAQQYDADQQRKTDSDKAAQRAQDTNKSTDKTDTDQSVNGDDTQSKRKHGRQLAQQSQEENTPTLKSLVPPKAQLSPADEVSTFAETSGTQSKSPISADAQSAQALTSSVNSGHAVDAEGGHVTVDIITPQSQPDSAQVLNLASRAQAATAALYARNNDIAFNGVALSQLAA